MPTRTLESRRARKDDRAERLLDGLNAPQREAVVHGGGPLLVLACARILRAEAERLGYTKRFSIYDEADSVRLVRRCLDELAVDPKRFSPRAIKAQISRAKNQLQDAAAYREQVGSFFEQTAADAYDLYEQRIHEMNAVDFDDLLFRTVNLLELFD